MSHHKLMLPILAVIVGVAASAFTTISNHQQAKTEETYYWFESNADGTVLQQYALSDSPSADSPNGCTTGNDYCSKGFVESKTIIDPVTQHRELLSGIGPNNYDNFSKKN